MASGEQAMYISTLNHRYYSVHDFTAGLHAKLDLSLSNHKLEWYNMYVRTNSKGVRYNNSVNTEYISADSYTQDDELRSISLRRFRTACPSFAECAHPMQWQSPCRPP